MPNVHLVAALCLAILTYTSGSSASDPRRTIHVLPTGNDKAAGTSDQPLKTLKAALEVAKTGDIIRLAAGNYAGKVKTRTAGVTIEAAADAIVSSPSERGIEVLHDKTVIRGLTVEKCDIGIWVSGASECLLEDLTIRDMEGEGLRIKNQSCRNVVRNCRFERMGRTGFNAAQGRKNGEAIYVGTAPEQRKKNQPPNVPDRCLGNVIENCVFKTEAAEAVDFKEDSEENIVRNCRGDDSRDPDGAIFGARGDRNRFEACVAHGGLGHGFRFGGDTVKQGQYGQSETRTYGADNVMRDCRAENNSLFGVAPMVQPQDIDASNVFAGNQRGAIRK